MLPSRASPTCVEHGQFSRGTISFRHDADSSKFICGARAELSDMGEFDVMDTTEVTPENL